MMTLWYGHFPHRWPFVRGIHTGTDRFPSLRAINVGFYGFFVTSLEMNSISRVAGELRCLYRLCDIFLPKPHKISWWYDSHVSYYSYKCFNEILKAFCQTGFSCLQQYDSNITPTLPTTLALRSISLKEKQMMVIQMRWNITQLLIIPLQNFAHAMTAQLSWHVQNFVARLDQNLDGKNWNFNQIWIMRE